ncbi:hypothetical protein PoB_005997400 [Plakobranchus ocellatus]|uniref:Uncharacterized protein n=1 Tax=Plakobranchus ocellatus TaxID=259542 RepID=A0AAV4CNN1_9GAST|nr:hypothetical protein PoB_005997400 [Plakobranchus ocellatus]
MGEPHRESNKVRAWDTDDRLPWSSAWRGSNWLSGREPRESLGCTTIQNQEGGENLDVGREAAQSESSFNSNTVRPAPHVDENVNLDLSLGSETESENENIAVYDADTEVDDGPDVDFVVDLDQDQQNYDSGQWQKNTNGFPKLPRFSAQFGLRRSINSLSLMS